MGIIKKQEYIMNSHCLTATKLALSAVYGCSPAAFDSQVNLFFPGEDSSCLKIACFGKGAVFCAPKPLLELLHTHYALRDPKEFMSAQGRWELETFARVFGQRFDNELVRYLPVTNTALMPPDKYTYQFYHGAQVKRLFVHKDFQNALGYNQYDILALAAFDGPHLCALAGADDRLGNLWQIGIDVLPACQCSGLGSYLVNALTRDIFRRGKVPFYTTWSANLASTRTALRAGYRPCWLELTFCRL